MQEIASSSVNWKLPPRGSGRNLSSISILFSSIWLISSNAPVFTETVLFVQCTFQHSVKNHHTWSKGHCLCLNIACVPLNRLIQNCCFSRVCCRASKTIVNKLHMLAWEYWGGAVFQSALPLHQMQSARDNQTSVQSVIDCHIIIIPQMAFISWRSPCSSPEISQVVWFHAEGLTNLFPHELLFLCLDKPTFGLSTTCWICPASIAVLLEALVDSVWL